MPTTPLLTVGLCAAAAMRALGDARRSMFVTVWAALTNAALDPVFIFGFGWGIEGAAVASLAARVVLLAIACRAIFLVHALPTAFRWRKLQRDMSAIIPIAAPALLTNMATPIGAAYVLKTMASFGDGAVAGAAILGRITPVAFAAVFSLSSAIGPIIGQNAGAGLYRRVRHSLMSALLLNIGYSLAIWLLLFLLTDFIVKAFDASGDAAELIRFYTHWLTAGFMFNGMLFIANAAFNNLHRAYLATLFNFSRMLLGTVPLVYLFSHWFGAVGVLTGEIAGAILFGSLAYAAAFWHVRRIEKSNRAVAPSDDGVDASTAWPYSSPRTQLSQSCARSESTGDS